MGIDFKLTDFKSTMREEVLARCVQLTGTVSKPVILEDRSDSASHNTPQLDKQVMTRKEFDTLNQSMGNIYTLLERTDLPGGFVDVINAEGLKCGVFTWCDAQHSALEETPYSIRQHRFIASLRSGNTSQLATAFESTGLTLFPRLANDLSPLDATPQDESQMNSLSAGT